MMSLFRVRFFILIFISIFHYSEITMSHQCPCCKEDGTRCKCKTKTETCHHHAGPPACPYGKTPHCIDEDETYSHAPRRSPRSSPDIDDFQLGEFDENDLALAVQMSLRRENKPKNKSSKKGLPV